jgi:hypothetical protein
MSRHLISIFFALAIVACYPQKQTSPIAWKTEDVIGLSMSREDEKTYCSYHFNKEGSVAISVHSKKGGWSVGPLSYWKRK